MAEKEAPSRQKPDGASHRKKTSAPKPTHAPYKTLARLDAIALDVEPDAEGQMPASVLWAIGLADAIDPDVECEPSFGWSELGPTPCGRTKSRRADYTIRHCLDLEPDGDEQDNNGMEFAEEDLADDEPWHCPVHLPGGGGTDTYSQLGEAPVPKGGIYLWSDGDGRENWSDGRGSTHRLTASERSKRFLDMHGGEL